MHRCYDAIFKSNSSFRSDLEEPCRPTGCSMQEKSEREQGNSMDNTVQSGFALTASVAPQRTGFVSLVLHTDLIQLKFSKQLCSTFSKSVAQIRKKALISKKQTPLMNYWRSAEGLPECTFTLSLPFHADQLGMDPHSVKMCLYQLHIHASL